MTYEAYDLMFTIVHEFSSTIITLVDEGAAQLQEDLIIDSFCKWLTIEQCDVSTDKINKLTLSMAQLKDSSAAINLPQGVYTRFYIKNLNDNIRSSDRNCF